MLTGTRVPTPSTGAGRPVLRSLQTPFLVRALDALAGEPHRPGTQPEIKASRSKAKVRLCPLTRGPRFLFVADVEDLDRQPRLGLRTLVHRLRP